MVTVDGQTFGFFFCVVVANEKKIVDQQKLKNFIQIFNLIFFQLYANTPECTYILGENFNIAFIQKTEDNPDQFQSKLGNAFKM